MNNPSGISLLNLFSAFALPPVVQRLLLVLFYFVVAWVLVYLTAHFPNGEMRNVRNIARGTFRLGTVQVDVKSSRMEEVSAVQNRVAAAAPVAIPELISPPEIISADGEMGAQTRFTLFAKAEYGKGAVVRRRLLQMIHEALAEAGVEVGG